MKKVETPALLALPEELEVSAIEMLDDVFTISAHATRKYPCCPLCGTPAQQFHSHYMRQSPICPLVENECVCRFWYMFL